LDVRWLGPDQWELLAPLVYQSDVLGRIDTVPMRFVTNFASVPRAPFAYLIAGGRGPRIATVHDYLYGYPQEYQDALTRALADAVLREGLALDDVPGETIRLMWAGVRNYGASHWKGPADPAPTGNRSGEIIESP
jgi:hypothetical protein